MRHLHQNAQRLVFASLLIGGAAQATVQFVGPSPYLQVQDNPFLSAGGTVFIEDFEDGLVNTLGLTASGGAPSGRSMFTDSVDADDGTVDGSGALGQSWYSGNGLEAITFSFSAAALGGLPTQAGIVISDVGNRNDGGPLGEAWAFLQVYNGAGVLQGASAFYFGNGSALSNTAEDRFIGAVDAGGIGSIRVGFSGSVDWEVDHVSYVGAVPEPATWALWGLGMAGLAGALRARRRGTGC